MGFLPAIDIMVRHLLFRNADLSGDLDDNQVRFYWLRLEFTLDLDLQLYCS
jgi:hypothetical protein